MNKYSQLTPEQLENHFSNYLIDSWSYSKVACFARNEKAFEMLYVYCEKDRRSISSIAGNAYHVALAAYFENFTETLPANVVNMTQIAYDYLQSVPANDWRLSDKFPTVEQASAESVRLVNILIENFAKEIETYTENISRILSVEIKEDAWVTVNGVDIPLPLHFIIDCVAETKDGKTVIIDHKTKSAYTPEAEAALKHGKQTIAYVIGYETTHPGSHIDEAWFIENKTSKNRDGSAQLRKHVIDMSDDVRPYYEAQLYAPLRRMLQAVSDPDYVYTLNDTDNLCDMATLAEFETRTMIAEVEDFQNVPEDKKEMIAKRQRKIKDSAIAMISPKVITEFRKNAASFITFDYTHSNMSNSEKIEHAFRTFGKQVQVAYEINGFSCTSYLCEAAVGVKLDALSSYSMNLANVLNVPKVRIPRDLVMHEGKSYLSIEVNQPSGEILHWDKSYLDDTRIPLGLDNFRKPLYWDIKNQSTPHMLVCGASGSGKSVMLNSTIKYARAAGIDDIIILDPKYEFCDLEDVQVYNEIEDIEQALRRLVADMNDMIKNHVKRTTLVIFDEIADALDQSKELHKKEKIEMPMDVCLKMLLQKGRSCGIRMVAATQRADVATINGTMKANFSVLVCFRMPKALDSVVVLGEEGAEALAGKGDGLMRSPEYMDQTIRFQAFYNE